MQMASLHRAPYRYDVLTQAFRESLSIGTTLRPALTYTRTHKIGVPNKLTRVDQTTGLVYAI